MNKKAFVISVRSSSKRLPEKCLRSIYPKLSLTEFINLANNPVAEMIIDLAKVYPEISVEDTDWYKLNNEVTPEIQATSELLRSLIDNCFDKVMNLHGEGVFSKLDLSRYEEEINKTSQHMIFNFIEFSSSSIV